MPGPNGLSFRPVWIEKRVILFPSLAAAVFWVSRRDMKDCGAHLVF